jgi:hypothetical protein
LFLDFLSFSAVYQWHVVEPISIRSVHHVGMANSAGVSISTAKKTVDV